VGNSYCYPIGMKIPLTQEKALDVFEYREGALYWKKVNPQCKVVKVGDEAGMVATLKGDKYRRLFIDGYQYLTHRVIYLMHYGHIPKVLDHIDGNSLNNKIENLRPASLSENAMNAKAKSTNSSGMKNVYWYEKYKKWLVKITFNKKEKFLGYFEDKELAELVSIEARNKFHGNFACERI